MKKIICAVVFSLLAVLAFAQERYALVIGNSAYVPKENELANPKNDAAGINKTLQGLGFKVDMIQNANLKTMNDAAERFRANLSRSKNAYGFFFFAGHGVQVQGQNFLLPTDAVIAEEQDYSTKCFPVQDLLDMLEKAGNDLNIVVLDACRNNPFAEKITAARGLSVRAATAPPVGLAPINEQPASSIVVLATSAGKTASDGQAGTNGLFTGELLKHLANPELEVKDVFFRTGEGVVIASNGTQKPAVYINGFFTNLYFTGGSKTPEANTGVAYNTIAGVWNGTLSYSDKGQKYRDAYKIELNEDSTCTVTIRSKEKGADTTQTGEGYWSYDEKIFRMECNFWDTQIPRLEALSWKSMYLLDNGNRRLKINIKPAPNYDGVVGLSLTKGR